MDFVVAMGKAAVGSQSGLHTFPLFLADKGRDLRHQDSLFSGHVDTAETGVLARRGTRAAFQRATTTHAEAVTLSGQNAVLEYRYQYAPGPAWAFCVPMKLSAPPYI